MRRGSGTSAGRPLLLLGCLVLASAGGCAVDGPKTPGDPWEGSNRRMFAFNDGVDRYVVGPAARGWIFVTPGFVRTGIENFFENLLVPKYFLNNMLQGRPVEAGSEVMRFLFNSTIGVAGFWDAAEWADFPAYREDFGLTLGHWGVPAGPYLVYPILGPPLAPPSTPRDTVGLIVDGYATPIAWYFPFYVTIGARAFDLFNLRAQFDEELEQNREEAFDYYVFWRNAYWQNREHRLNRGEGGLLDAAPAAEAEGDLYYLDDLEDEGEDVE